MQLQLQQTVSPQCNFHKTHCLVVRWCLLCSPPSACRSMYRLQDDLLAGIFRQLSLHERWAVQNTFGAGPVLICDLLVP